MKRSVLLLAVLLGLSSGAQAQTRPLPQGEIRSNGDITFGNALKLGRREGNKTTITPDTLQILGPSGTDKKLRVGGSGDLETLNESGEVISQLTPYGGLFLGKPDISWAEQWQPGFSHRGQGGASRLTVVSPVGRYAISSATRTSDNKTLDQINVITDNTMCVNDNIVRDHRVWCRYEHGIITPNAKSQGHINDENSVANFSVAVPSDPFDLNPHGQSSALRLDSGVGDGVDYPIPGQGTATANTVSAAATIMSNGAKFFAGLQIGAGTFDTSLTGGIGHAIQMPTFAALTWQHRTGLANTDWRLYSAAVAPNGPFEMEGFGQVRVGPSGLNKVTIEGGGGNPTVATTGGDLIVSSATGVVRVPGRLVVTGVPWTDYNPAITADGGSTATFVSGGQYEVEGKTLRISIQANIALAAGGTPGREISIPLPPGLTLHGSCNGAGRENAKTGLGLTAYAYNGETALRLLDVLNGSVVQDGASFSLSATCQIN